MKFLSPPAGSFTALPDAADAPANPPQLVSTFTAKQLLNQQWKTTLSSPTLGGITVVVSGLMPRDYKEKKKAFLVLYSKTWGATPLLFNINKLISNEVEIPIGDANYRINVDPSEEKFKSTLKIERSDGQAGGATMTLGELLTKTFEAGKELKLYETSYRLFYVNEAEGKDVEVKLNKKLATVILMRPGKAGEYEPFLYPAEDIPEDTVKFFELEGGKKVGFRMTKEGQLEVHDQK